MSIALPTAAANADADNNIMSAGDMATIEKTIEKKLTDRIIDCSSFNQLSQGGASHHHFLLRGEKSQYVAKVFPRQPFAISHDIATQQQLYDFFHQRNIMTPPVLCSGKQWLVLPYLNGVADGWQATENPDGDDNLAKSLAVQLALIHDSKFAFQKKFPHLCYDDRLQAWQNKKQMDIKNLLGDAMPMKEKTIALANDAIEKIWASQPQNMMLDLVPCHGDFRTGNFLLQQEPQQEKSLQESQQKKLQQENSPQKKPPQKLLAILDWEMASWGLAWEDIGWLAAPCWRYHQPSLTCGGLGMIEIFLQHYLRNRTTMANNITVADAMANLHWFQSLAMLRWGLLLSKQWHRKQNGLDILPELPQTEPDLTAIFSQAIELLRQE